LWTRLGERRVAVEPKGDRLSDCSPSARPSADSGPQAGVLDRARPTPRTIRPQLREYLAWYEEVLGRVESGAIVAPGEQERLTEEASAVAHLLDLLDSSADESAS
jgi:hypothetical protein